jgi:hypothetical protein
MIDVNILPIFISYHFINQPLDLWTYVVEPTNIIDDLLNLYNNIRKIWVNY